MKPLFEQTVASIKANPNPDLLDIAAAISIQAKLQDLRDVLAKAATAKGVMR